MEGKSEAGTMFLLLWLFSTGKCVVVMLGFSVFSFKRSAQSFTGGKRQCSDSGREDSGFLILCYRHESMFLKYTVSEAAFPFPIFSIEAKMPRL